MFDGNKNKIEKEILLLKNRYKNSIKSDKNIEILVVIDTLAEFYEGITNKKHPNLYPSKFLLKKCYKDYNEKTNQIIIDFIKQKKIHNSIAKKMLSTMDDDLDAFFVETEENKEIPFKDMCDIMMEFLSTIGRENLLTEALEKKRIFRMSSKEELIGLTVYNNFFNTYYISINKKVNDTTKMVTLIHELGHVYDLKNLNKKDYNNYITSVYSEVNSIMYEKKFSNFLIDNKINLGDVFLNICDYYISVFDWLGKMLTLSELDNNLLKNQKFKNVKENILLKQLSNKAALEYIDLSDVRYIDLDNSLCYSYGNMLATYFINLEKEDKDLYKYKYNEFLNIHDKEFNISDFRKIIPDNELLFQSMKSEMNQDIKVKKKILTN